MTGFDRVHGLWDGEPADVPSIADGVTLAQGTGVPVYVMVGGHTRFKCFPSGYSRQHHASVLETCEARIVSLGARVAELEGE